MTNKTILRKELKRKLQKNLWFKLLFFLPTLFVGEHLLSSSLISQNLSFSVYTSHQNVVLAQTLRPNDIASSIYEKMPEMELANTYTSLETGENAVDNTLVSRLVRYHQYVKSRPTIYRLDWKLTLADYLGKNEIIKESRYPGNSTLTQNPFQNDRKIIQSLTREQRNELVNLLVSMYNPNYNQTRQDSPQKNTEEQTDNNPPNTIELPTPGGAADLLAP